MTTVTIQMTDKCSGGDHLTMLLTRGAQSRTVQMTLTDIKSAASQDDLDGFCKVALKIALAGKSKAESVALISSGLTVTI